MMCAEESITLIFSLVMSKHNYYLNCHLILWSKTVWLYVCVVCLPGYHGLYCEEEYNECLSAPCQNSATCRDLINAYECACTPQYEGRGVCVLISIQCDSPGTVLSMFSWGGIVWWCWCCNMYANSMSLYSLYYECVHISDYVLSTECVVNCEIVWCWCKLSCLKQTWIQILFVIISNIYAVLLMSLPVAMSQYKSPKSANTALLALQTG